MILAHNWPETAKSSWQCPFKQLITFAMLPLPRGGKGKEELSEARSLLPKSLTLAMTKICDIPYSIYDLTKH